MENLVLAEMSLTHTGAVDFDALVYTHARFVMNVAYAVLRNAEDAEDVVQETFLRAFRSGEIGKVGRMRSWLAKIAWRLAVNRLRRRSDARGNDEYESLIQRSQARGLSAEDLLLMKERETLLAGLLRSLPGDLRETFTLLSVDGMTSSEAAEVLGISESSVRDRLSRARKLLKEKLAALVEGKYGP